MRETSATARDSREALDSPLERLRVLLVEDDARSREALALALEDHGALVMAVDSVQAALPWLEPIPPSVLISDIEMPEQDGFALIRQVRALDAHHQRRTPAIAVTGLDLAETGAALRAAGFDEHLAKPVDLPVLVERIRALVG
jgi:CheY-like chemotaxis protein